MDRELSDLFFNLDLSEPTDDEMGILYQIRAKRAKEKYPKTFASVTEEQLADDYETRYEGFID